LAAILSVVFIVGATASTLRLTKGVPSLLQENVITQYNNIQEAEFALGAKISLPAYFPEIFMWPPQQIQIKREGKTSLISLVFLTQRGKQPGLVIHQIFFSETKTTPELDFVQPKLPDSESIVRVGNEIGDLKTGTDENGRKWSCLTWGIQDCTVIVMSLCDRKNLLRIAASID
jgi:hypothetical protein